MPRVTQRRSLSAIARMARREREGFADDLSTPMDSRHPPAPDRVKGKGRAEQGPNRGPNIPGRQRPDSLK